MSLSTFCGNCGNAKQSTEYNNPYCADCLGARSQARDAAQRDGRDVSTAMREALLLRSKHVNANRVDPRVPYERQGRFDIVNLGINAHPTPGVGRPEGQG